MSLIDKFTPRILNDEKDKLKDNNLLLNVKYINRTGFANVINDLCEMGYDIDSLSFLIEKHKFNNVDEAITLLSINPLTKKYNHNFYKLKKNDNCGICNDKYERHNNYNIKKKNEIIIPPLYSNNYNSNSAKSFNSEDSYRIDTELKPFNVKTTKINKENKKPRRLKSNKSNKSDFIYGKIKISAETQKLFENPNICTICYENLINKNNISHLCNHFFCDNCIKTYLTNKIISGNILNIKCLLGGCQREYTDNDIKQNVIPNIYKKYKKFKFQKLILSNPEKHFVQCPYPDCPEIVEVKNFEEEFVQCENKHFFCYKCRSLNYHRKYQCQIEDKRLLSELYNYNHFENYRQCPKCNILIEKNNGNNEITCINCGYKFCWLCLEECTSEHFNIYNFTGCPGMRNKENKNNNKCLNCLWYFLSSIIALIFIIFLVIFYFFFGFSYELLKCYKRKRKSKGNNCIRLLLIILGIILQPIYLFFYVFYSIFIIMTRYKCLLFCCFFRNNF